MYNSKAEFTVVGTFFHEQISFPEKLDIEKNKTTFSISVLKVVYKLGLVFSNSNFFINKSSQERKSVCEKNTFFCKFSFSRLKTRH